MSLIRRNITRCIKNATEVTNATDTPSSVTTTFVQQTTDAFYIGYRKPFASRHFQLGTVNSQAATLALTYWNGSAWVAVEDLVDQTIGFTQSGFIAWQNPGNWAPYALTPITDVELYWIRIKTSANLSAGTTLASVLNLFCDDMGLQTYYPELLSDVRWLPSGAANFLAQYVAAKDMVVTRLKQDDIINDESQILDVNEVALAAVHAAAWCIINPIARSEEDREMSKTCFADFTRELNRVKFDFDLDDSGKITEAEQGNGNVYSARGRT